MAKLSVRAQERFLNRVFRVLCVHGHAISQAEDGAAVTLDEHTKGLRVARARLFDGRYVCNFHPAVRLDCESGGRLVRQKIS